MAAHPPRLEWSASVQSKEHELSGSYTVLFFLGPAPKSESPQDWWSSPSFVGTHDVFTDDQPPPTDEEDKEGQSILLLDEPLRARLPPDPSSEDVKSYVRNNIHWRIQKTSGKAVKNSDLPSLKVVLFSLQLKWNATYGVYMPDSKPTEYPEVTRGLDGI